MEHPTLGLRSVSSSSSHLAWMKLLGSQHSITCRRTSLFPAIRIVVHQLTSIGSTIQVKSSVRTGFSLPSDDSSPMLQCQCNFALHTIYAQDTSLQ